MPKIAIHWPNVRLIMMREIRDQLRDRRTLFVIAILPIVLYPLLAMSILQIAQFRRDQPSRVAIVGTKQIEEASLPPLLETIDGRPQFVASLFDSSDSRLNPRLFELSNEPADARASAQALIDKGTCDAILYFPPQFAADFADTKSAEVFFNEGNDKSLLALDRLNILLGRWMDQVKAKNLADHGISIKVIKPFEINATNVSATSQGRQTAMWSKILPILLLLWALTGAFYPAIDLCAGEKERGTLETLLCSPAERSEIVLGKLFTVMLFSAVTALLNLISGAITGRLLLEPILGTGFPPPLTAVWLLMALVPISALFSALALALAAFARSSKEGQYYLMPLLLITMPLALLAASPGVELTLGNSLIPITGIVLLLRSLMEGHYGQALPFLLPVIGVTMACCLFSIRWAIDQFNTESVLFRESERLDIGLWLRHLLRDREATPTVAKAVFCGMTILLIRFFLGTTLSSPHEFRDLMLQNVIVQWTVILIPTLLMTMLLTNSARQTLLLRWPKWSALPAAVLLAIAMHPVVTSLQQVVNYLYPISDEIKAGLAKFLPHALSPVQLAQLLLTMAILPAICEELAFRGFILSGFRRLGHRRRAIIWSAIFFGLTHAILQQSLIACLVGMVIGLLAVQTGSILPGMLYHVVHNSLAFLPSQIDSATFDSHRWLAWIFPEAVEFCCWPAVVGGAALATLLIVWFCQLPWQRSTEEALQQAIDRAAQSERPIPACFS